MVILFDQYNLPDDFYEIVFSTDQQKTVAALLVRHIKENGGTLSKPQMSSFATELHEGKIKHNGQEISYNKRQFYDRILTPMKAMGLVGYDMYNKIYSLSKNFHKAMTEIADMWLEEFDKEITK